MGYISTFPLKDPSFGRMKQKSLMLDEYRYLYNNMKLTFNIRLTEKIVNNLKANQARYQKVADKIKGCHWVVVALIHQMESGADFNRHLHNGDPLIDRTVHAPVGRPKEGTPPFTWEQSALDVLKDRFPDGKFLSVPEILYFCEAYNGFGTRKVNVKVKIMGFDVQPLSAYLWAGTNWYVKGKFKSDGIWDSTLISKQLGASPILQRLL